MICNDNTHCVDSTSPCPVAYSAFVLLFVKIQRANLLQQIFNCLLVDGENAAFGLIKINDQQQDGDDRQGKQRNGDDVSALVGTVGHAYKLRRSVKGVAHCLMGSETLASLL